MKLTSEKKINCLQDETPKLNEKNRRNDDTTKMAVHPYGCIHCHWQHGTGAELAAEEGTPP